MNHRLDRSITKQSFCSFGGNDDAALEFGPSNGAALIQLGVSDHECPLAEMFLLSGEMIRDEINQRIGTALIDRRIETGLGILGHVLGQQRDRLENGFAIDIRQEPRQSHATQ